MDMLKPHHTKRKRTRKERLMFSTLTTLTLIQCSHPFSIPGVSIRSTFGYQAGSTSSYGDGSNFNSGSIHHRHNNPSSSYRSAPFAHVLFSTSKSTPTDADVSGLDDHDNVSVNGSGGANGTNTEAPTAPEVNQWRKIMTDPDPFINAPNSPSIYTALSALNEYDYKQIETYWDKLMPHVSYLGTSNASKAKEALKVAYCAHRGQARKSGEPFIIHPLEVAILLAGLQMDAETVMAGLLHDTVEDTDLTFSQIEEMFGRVVKSIVEGETKVSKLPRLAFEDYADEQAENLRQMFVAMTDDYRIIIVKLADRLHNMRTLRYMKPEKQIKISRETLDIFAPLAHRMGIWQFKSELEDTSFKYLFPREYKRLNKRLRRHQKKFRETLDKTEEILNMKLSNDPTLKEQAVDVKVIGRTKEVYSLWYKMKMKEEQNLDHITDVVALRVIIEPRKPRGYEDVDDDTDFGVWLCYHVLGVVQNLPGFQPVPTKVKDYISFPKPNGYQSLHTAIMWNGQTIEVQIRTSAMHQIAEYGMASHWAFKDEKRLIMTHNELYNTPWLSSIKEWQDEVVCARDFVDCVRRELLGKRVFVFLRNGKILNLAKGATVIDAAFQIHTEVGLTMHGVEINGRPVPFSYELRNGDVVSVLTGNGKPATDWMRFAKIRSTRSKLRSYFRRKQKESLCDAGAILLMDYLNTYKDFIQDSSYLKKKFAVPTSPEDMANFLPGKTQYNDVDDLLIDIGKSHEREFLRTVVAKIFLVSQTTLATAEEKTQDELSNQVLIAVKAKRQSAMDVSAALLEDEDDFSLDDVDGRMTTSSGIVLSDDMNILKNGNTKGKNSMNDRGEEMSAKNINTNGEKKVNGSTSSFATPKQTRTTLDGGEEIADPEFLCDYCHPILGDDIVGTRPMGASQDDSVTTVHRCGCPIAQQAINELKSPQRQQPNNNDGKVKKSGLFKKKNGKRSITTRIKNRLLTNKLSRIESKEKSASEDDDRLEAVQLKWDESNMLRENILYLTELQIVAEDRKYLLADCSEMVSEMSEIVKTGSLSTEEHAIFNFLTKVESVEHLQKLMNSLMQIDSVMSVERKLGPS